MTKTISFTDIDVSGDGWIRCNVTRESVQEFRIELPYSFNPSPDLIAASYASLCGREFDEVRIDLPLGANQSKLLSERLQAKVVCQPGVDRRRRPGTENALNFSGGFDSLAAMDLLSNPLLVSLDFGGQFMRERDFFSRFTPLTFRTNMTVLRLNSYSWEFMGVGSILLRDELQLGAYSFGSIMASSLPRVFSKPLDQSMGGIRVANDLGMRLQNPVAGLTEIASLLLVARNHPALLPDALRSVANRNEDKFQRKHQMLQAVRSVLGLPIQLPEPRQKVASLTWGQSFATDLSSLYVMKTLGIDHVSESYKGGVPERVAAALPGIDLAFMTRVNPHAYEGVDSLVLGDWYSRMAQNQILPYQREDWFDAAKVMKLLRSS